MDNEYDSLESESVLARDEERAAEEELKADETQPDTSLESETVEHYEKLTNQ